MSSSLRRGAVAATVTALSSLTLGACGAGLNAQTDGVRPDNASVSVDDMKIQNVNIVTSEDGPAAVTAHIFNQGNQDEVLRGITIEGAGDVELSSTNLKVPAGGSLILGGKGNAYATVNDTDDITNGNAQPLSFDLSGTGSVELDVTVVPATGTYEKWGPTAQPSPTQQPDDADEGPDEGADEAEGSDGAEDGDGATEDGQDQPGEGDGAEDGEETPAN